MSCPRARSRAAVLSIATCLAFSLLGAGHAAGDTDLGEITGLSTSKNGNEDVSFSNKFELMQKSDGTYYAAVAACTFACLPQTPPTVSAGMDIKYKDKNGVEQTPVIQGDIKPDTGFNQIKALNDGLILSGPVTPGTLGQTFYAVPLTGALADEFFNANPPVFGMLPVVSFSYIGLVSSPTSVDLVAASSFGGPAAVFSFDPTKLGVQIGNDSNGLFFGTLVSQSSAPSGSASDVILLGRVVPEPSSLALSGVGVLMVLGFARARRRRA